MTVVPRSGGNARFATLTPPVFTQKDGRVYQARAYVKIDGQLYTLKSFNLSKNAHGATNTGSFVVSFADEPDWTAQLFRDTFGANDNNEPVYVEIWAGFPDNPGTLPTTSGALAPLLRRARRVRPGRHIEHRVSRAVDRVAADHGSRHDEHPKLYDRGIPAEDCGALQYFC